MTKCICNKIINEKCTHKLCYDCCCYTQETNMCEVHTRLKLYKCVEYDNSKYIKFDNSKCKCGNSRNLKCKNYFCRECCIDTEYECKFHKNPNFCKCGNLGSLKCIKKCCSKCSDECSGENCESHAYKLKLCKCDKHNFDVECLNKTCIQCCNNKQCEQHYTFCKCKLKKVN